MKRGAWVPVLLGILLAIVVTPTAARADPPLEWAVAGAAWIEDSGEDWTYLRETRTSFSPTGSGFHADGALYVDATYTDPGGSSFWWTLVDVAYARSLDDGRVLVTGPTVAAGGGASGYTGWQYYHLVFDGRRAVVFSGGEEPGDETTASNWIQNAYDPYYYEPWPYVGDASWPIARGTITIR